MNEPSNFLRLAATAVLATSFVAAGAATLSSTTYDRTHAELKATYKADHEACNEQAGNANSVCVAQAKAARDKAKANAKMAKDVTEAGQDADDTKMKADFVVAQTRCDAMNGDAKDACVAGARARFGQ